MKNHLLFPFTVLYDAITRTRNFLYDKEIFKTTVFDIPTIVVGNLSMGGTGKTPMIAYLIELLQNKYNIAVLSRGYKRLTKGFVLADKNATATSIGDESFMLAQQFPKIQVAVCENRVKGMQQLLKLSNKPSIVLLDDAFQHRRLKASNYILLTSFQNLYTNDEVLPMGKLRESKKGANRADNIVVTKCPTHLSVVEKKEIINKLNPLPNQHVYFSKILYMPFVQNNSKQILLSDLKDYEVILVTGIASPESLLLFLSEKNITYQHLNYPDHYSFSATDIKFISATYQKKSSLKKCILTTKKDFVRLQGKLSDLYYIDINIDIEDGNGKKFHLSAIL